MRGQLQKDFLENIRYDRITKVFQFRYFTRVCGAWIFADSRNTNIDFFILTVD